MPRVARDEAVAMCGGAGISGALEAIMTTVRPTTVAGHMPDPRGKQMRRQVLGVEEMVRQAGSDPAQGTATRPGDGEAARNAQPFPCLNGSLSAGA